MTTIRLLVFGLAILSLMGVAAAPCLADGEINVNGGGIIKQGFGPEKNKITFSVNVYADEDVPGGVGQFKARFHHLIHHPDLEKVSFFSDEITDFYMDFRIFDSDGISTPYTFIKIWADGRLGHEEGWSVVVRFSDFGVPPQKMSLPYNHADAIRLQLVNPDGDHVYDTAWEYDPGEFEFDREQIWRHVLDGGNISVNLD
jgi:hypothetical protein